MDLFLQGANDAYNIIFFNRVIRVKAKTIEGNYLKLIQKQRKNRLFYVAKSVT